MRNLRALLVLTLAMCQLSQPARCDQQTLLDARAMMQSITHAFGDRDIPVSYLLDRCRTYLNRYPSEHDAGFARQSIPILESMIAEESKHPLLSDSEIAKLPKNRQIAELVRSLTAQNMRTQEYGFPRYDIERTWEQTPVAKLVKFGTAAVPHLLPLLTDHRLTRSIVLDRHENGYVHQVRDLAYRALEIIANTSFDTYDNPMGQNGEGRAARMAARAREWWVDYQRRGERLVLIDGVRSGKRGAHTQAERLVKAYPQSAAPAIAAGIRNSKDEWLSTALVSIVAKLKTPAALRVVRDQMIHGANVETRLAAARIVAKSDSDAAITSMERAWCGLKVTGTDSIVTNDLVDFLARSGRKSAVDILASGINGRSAEQRWIVVERFVFDKAYVQVRWPDYQSVRRQSIFEERKEYLDAVERLLVSALDDKTYHRTARVYLISNTPDNRMREGRLCDLAAKALNSLWPQKYTPKPTESSGEAEREMAISQNRR